MKMEGQPSPKATFFLAILFLCSAIVLTHSLQTFPELQNKIPPLAIKAGARLKPEFQSIGIELPKSAENPLQGLEEIKDDLEYEEDESEEKSCEEGMYWHIRGAQCVPERCPNGRDHVTGKCQEDELFSRSFYGSSYRRPNYRRYRPWMDNNRPIALRRHGKIRRPKYKIFRKTPGFYDQTNMQI